MKQKKVAILGYSFRLPGGSKEDFWASLLAGKNLIAEVSQDRWAHDAFLHPERTHPGTSYTFSAGSIGDVASFDAQFFGISPREAALMDPQQRKLLEWSWEAFENAGMKPSSLRGSSCGVYIGIASTDYSYRLSDDLAACDSSVATGNTASIAANRLSYFYDLHGPSMAIDTACSSSLVAFHQACRSITSGESEMALAGGISLHLHPYGFIVFSKASMLSRRGVCNVFDESGDGYVRSEGGGIFVLKDYDKALADGDRIIAVVPATAVNTDGRKVGLTVPNDKAQADLLRQVYAHAGISVDDLDYLEAHGTGTAVGDPIETRAIGMALGMTRTTKPLPIGSVKSNIGHLEAASGIAGLVKALHCIENRVVPATIGINRLNPNIDFQGLKLKVVTEPLGLRKSGDITIGVNSFGFGGANAHVIVNSPPLAKSGTRISKNNHLLPIVVSGKTRDAMCENAKRLVDQITRQPVPLYDLAYTLGKRREWHEYRAVAYCRDLSEAKNRFSNLSDDNANIQRANTGNALTAPSGPAFIYSGNGSQWLGMGRVLLKQSATFRSAVEEVDFQFRMLSGVSLIEKLNDISDDGIYDLTEIAQPALFAVQVGVTKMLAELGISPVAAMGHSVGEIAAAWCCGVLDLPGAVRVTYHRSRLQGLTKGLGRMAALGMSVADAQILFNQLGLQTRLSITGINSSRSITVAGTAQDLALLEAQALSEKKFYKELNLDYAFHSPVMDSIENEVITALRDLPARSGQLPFYSTVTGTKLPGEELQERYWWRNVREPVLFESATKSMLTDGINLFVEIGPHTILRSYLADSLNDLAIDGRIISTLTRDDESVGKIHTTAERILIAAGDIIQNQLLEKTGRLVPLPDYSWQLQRHWHPITSESLGLLEKTRAHPLLGYPLKQRFGTWENVIDTTSIAMLDDHIVGESVVFPGTGYLELALAAARSYAESSVIEIEDLEILSPLVLDSNHSKVVRTSIISRGDQLLIEGRDYAGDGIWTTHAKARIRPEPNDIRMRGETFQLPILQPHFSEESHRVLTRLAGLEYGSAFRCIEFGWLSENQALASLQIPESISSEVDQYLIHPAILDCAFQLIIQLLRDEVPDREGMAYVPTRVGYLTYTKTKNRPAYAKVKLINRTPHSLSADFALFDSDGKVIAVIGEARFRCICLKKQKGDSIRLLESRLEPMPLPEDNRNSLSTPEIVSTLESLVATLRTTESKRAFYSEVEPLLDNLAVQYNKELLRAHSTGGRIYPAPFHENHGAQRILRACLCSAERDQTLERTDEAWIIPSGESEQEIAAREIWNLLSIDYPQYFQLTHAIAIGAEAVRRELSGATNAKTTPLLAYPDLWRIATGTACRIEIAKTVTQIVRTHLARLPAEKRFSVLETADGAPLCMSALLQHQDSSPCDYLFVAKNGEKMAELASLQEKHPKLRLSSLDEPGSSKPSTHFAIVSLDQLSHSEARKSVDLAISRLVPNGSLLLIGLHRSRWFEGIYPGQYDHPEHASEYWQEYLAKAGLQSSTATEVAPGTLADLYFITASRSSGDDNAAKTTAPARIVLLVSKSGENSARIALSLTRALRLRKDETEVIVREFESESIENHLADFTGGGTPTQVIYWRGLSSQSGKETAKDRMQAQALYCEDLARLVCMLEQRNLNPALWIVTQGTFPCRAETEKGVSETADSVLWGFGRTLLNEHPQQCVRLLDLHGLSDEDKVGEYLARELRASDLEQEVVINRTGHRYVPRITALSHADSPRAEGDETNAPQLIRLGFDSPGQLRNLRWKTHPMPTLGEDMVAVEVKATGLNFRDVMYALGLLSDEAVENGFAGPTLGLEFSGIVTALGANVRNFTLGDRVIGFGSSCFANRVFSPENALAKIPEGLEFEAAATIPSVFMTVHYALKQLGQLQAGEKILVHGACGGVGLAAIQIARHLGAEIYATAGSDEKRLVLRNLGIRHIYDSRTLNFADEILRDTNGAGIDVVLNSLAGEAINRNLGILKPFGRFIELGKRDYYENTRIGLRPFRNNISYFGVDADQLMRERPDLTKRLFAEVMQLFTDGILSPLPVKAFAAEDIVEAFRFMQQARHIGKIVVTYAQPLSCPRLKTAEPKKTLTLNADATYLVSGGLGGFGLETAKWLVKKGARHLVLISRSGPTDGEAKTAIDEMIAAGINVIARACDVTSRTSMKALLSEIMAVHPPLKGIVHAAAVIEDGMIRNLTKEQIERVLAAKMLGADHLDELTRGMALDLFVLYSSATTVFGNPGQSAYIGANSYLEALARKRLAEGLPATCICWGAIDDAGFLARNKKIKEALQGRMGGQTISSAKALAYLEQMLLNKQSGLAVTGFDWRALARFLPTAKSPRFARIAPQFAEDEQSADSNVNIPQMLAEFDDAQLKEVFGTILRKEIGQILRIAPEKIDTNASIYDMGLDSLMGVELALALEDRFGTRLPVMVISENPTVGRLAEKLIAQLRNGEDGIQEPHAQSQTTQMKHVAAQHGVEIDETAQTPAPSCEDGKNPAQNRMIR